MPLYGAFADILFALDRGDAVVGRTNADAHDPRLASLPSVGTHMQPTSELIISLRPDAVLQMSGRREASVLAESLRGAGIPVLVFNLDSFESLFSATLALGALTGAPDRAKELANEWRERLKALPKIPGAPVTTFFEIRYPDLAAAGRTGIVNDIIKAAGGENIIEIPGKIARINEEIVIERDPETYIYQKGPMNPAPTDPGTRPYLRGSRAIRDGNILPVEERLFSRPGPGSIDAAEILAAFFAEVASNRKDGK